VIDRPKEPTKLDDEDDEFGDVFPSERPTTPAAVEPSPDERPTVSPPFDPAEYAKSSESKLAAVGTPPPQPLDPATKPPPPPEFDLPEEELPSVLGPPPRRPQITLPDEAETEEARLRSVFLSSDPPSDLPADQARANRSGSDEPPATRAYPSDYEGDPFGHLSSQASDEDAELVNMRDRFSLGDYTGALAIAERVLETDGANAEANRCAEECRAKLIQMYAARVGPLDRVPVVTVAREQLRWLSIDHRAGFLLSHIDGVSSLEMILDVSGMPLLDALKILAELTQQKVISFR
jgi:hypothetical protein